MQPRGDLVAKLLFIGRWRAIRGQALTMLFEYGTDSVDHGAAAMLSNRASTCVKRVKRSTDGKGLAGWLAFIMPRFAGFPGILRRTGVHRAVPDAPRRARDHLV